MKNSRYLAALVVLSLSITSASAKGINPQQYVASQTRQTAGGTTVRVQVTQSEIKANANPSNIGMWMGGGLLGGLIGAAVNSSRAKKAEVTMEPIRQALTGVDVDALAIDAAKQQFTGIVWLDGEHATFSKDSSVEALGTLLDGAPAGRVAIVDFTYDVSPNFDSVRVFEQIRIAHQATTNKAGKPIKPSDRFSYKNLDYVQSVTSVINRPAAATDKVANAAWWSEDGGKRIRAALTTAFAEIKRLTPRTLDLTPEMITAMQDKTNKAIGANGFQGRPVTSDVPAGTTLLWGPGFVSVQDLPEAPAA